MSSPGKSNLKPGSRPGTPPQQMGTPQIPRGQVVTVIYQQPAGSPCPVILPAGRGSPTPVFLPPGSPPPVYLPPGSPPPVFLPPGSPPPVIVSQPPGTESPRSAGVGSHPPVVMVYQPYKPQVDGLSDGMIMAIVTTLCCCWPFGCIAIWYACRSRGASDSGDFDSAIQYNRMSHMWSFMSILAGAIFIPLCFYFWF